MANNNSINPYLSIDKKYFKAKFDGQFIITLTDIVNMPALKQYINIYYLKDNKLNFDSFDNDIKIKIGKIFFEHYEYITWIGNTQYLNFSSLFEKFKLQESMQYKISKLNKNYYFKSDPSTQMYNLDFVTDSFLLFLITSYFYSRYSVEENTTKYINHTNTLTDVDLNQHQFVKVKDDINFVVNIFNNWISTSTNTIPFSPDYGNPLKELIQEKNIMVKISLIKSAIISFFEELSNLYVSLVSVDDITINILGSYSIEIAIFLTVSKEKVQFNIISENN